MHTNAFYFVASRVCLVKSTPPGADILEIGSRDINGTVRPLFRLVAKTYTGIDIVPGNGVDLVADGTVYGEPESFDAVICCEVLEHTPKSQGICENALRVLRPSGVLIVTCAGPSRAAHSADDGGPLTADEYYGNIREEDLLKWCGGFFSTRTIVSEDSQDIYFTAIKRPLRPYWVPFHLSLRVPSSLSP